MRPVIAFVVLALPAPLMAGVFLEGNENFWWVTDHQLSEPNNDDYIGEFIDSPNKVMFNEDDRRASHYAQPMDALELLIPTVSSGGITEYALTLEAAQPERSPGSDVLLRLDNLYKVELGFGMGDNFVSATEAAPELRFDSVEMVSPEIMGRRIPSFSQFPIVTLVEHGSNHLILQGTYDQGVIDGAHYRLSEFSPTWILFTPLDVPDLPLSVRDFYSEAELAGLDASEAPFTFRMHVLTEPGDYSGNATVEQADLDLVLLNWGASLEALPEDWVNERPATGIVDQAQLDGVLLNWGGSALGSPAGVPEPRTLVLLTAMALAWGIGLRHRPCPQPHHTRQVVT